MICCVIWKGKNKRGYLGTGWCQFTEGLEPQTVFENPVSTDKKMLSLPGEISTLGQILSFAKVAVGPHPNPCTYFELFWGPDTLVLVLGCLRHFSEVTCVNLNSSDHATCPECYIFSLLNHCKYLNV